MSNLNFTAEAFDAGVLLRWYAGAGSSTSTTSDLCEITIQYAEGFVYKRQRREKFPPPKSPEGVTGVPNIVLNNPPYVVRELQQPQLSNNVLYHSNLVNDTIYTYTIFVHYMDTGVWTGPVISNSVMPRKGISSPLVSGSLSFSKLGTNTRLMSDKDSMTEIVVWLSDDQVDRKTELEAVMRQLKPAHVRINIVYEPYYIAQTTSGSFASGTFASTSYNIVNDTLINKVPTIDSSFSGNPTIYGGS